MTQYPFSVVVGRFNSRDKLFWSRRLAERQAVEWSTYTIIMRLLAARVAHWWNRPSSICLRHAEMACGGITILTGRDELATSVQAGPCQFTYSVYIPSGDASADLACPYRTLSHPSGLAETHRRRLNGVSTRRRRAQYDEFLMLHPDASVVSENQENLSPRSPS
ncbi:hypothetical protein PGTUg99_011013 [Puccinia graminis f. sp. tritici]|uniref:Uncharacterized protein n=1 Tax=Puccinia graminis f. sp. tritici TaxID=56615 RepID=A0A5B0RWX8_PUCGR|nr:hypothetical protein PGTUg99_011013 [Puccinia graminis f. sp. tritici]